MAQTSAKKAAAIAGDWVVVAWTGPTPAEHARRPTWCDADTVRSQLKDAGHTDRITIEAAESWERAMNSAMNATQEKRMSLKGSTTDHPQDVAYINDTGRIQCGRYEFTSGDCVDVLINGKWIPTRIEHNGRNYYSVDRLPLVDHSVRYSED